MVEIVKLVTGEEAIGEVEATGDLLKIKNAVRLAMSHDGNVQMMPFAMFAKSKDVTLNVKHVLFREEVDSDVKNAYNSQFSGIVTATANSLSQLDFQVR